ncbi:MAG: NAD-dependent epimerase/dehydratase family protein, partial [Armatimonadota bacterium]|nr:NAD-dependent epimerase/dehydratase family protein [Armatimonadota bacterium]
MRVLVTGGAGFIGSQVAEAHLRRGDEVAVVDSLVSGRAEFVPPGARFYEMDIRDPAIGDVVAEVRPHLINHHAAQASVSVSM